MNALNRSGAGNMRYGMEALTACEQALAAPVQEPEYVQLRHTDEDGDASPWGQPLDPKERHTKWAKGVEMRLLYTTPPAQPAVPLNPMQPIVDVSGIKRFKANAIVLHLIVTHPSCDMNALSRMDFSDEDRMQFAQLIGYSVGGYADLSYVSDESYEAAEKAAHSITAAAPEKGNTP
jgi:hypothetical protein